MEPSHLMSCRNSLRNFGISISNYLVPSTPVAHDFVTSNVAFGNGALDLKVDPFTGNAVPSAEIFTTDRLKYASVRTVLKSSSVPGIVEGNFFYR
jgi:hypothetical protein